MMIGYDEMVAEIVWWRFHAKEQRRHGHLKKIQKIATVRPVGQLVGRPSMRLAGWPPGGSIDDTSS